MLFKGLSAFPITPANPDGSVDTDNVMQLTERLVNASVDSIGLLGSTGTYVYLAREERRRAITAARHVLKGKTPLMVGIGALRTDDVQKLAHDAAEEGVDALLLAPVSYTPLTDDEVFQHYKAVAEITDLPICIYNNPGTTHFTFSATLLARLAEFPNIQAVKMPLPARLSIAQELQHVRSETKDMLSIGYSGDWGAAEALLAGSDAWYSVVGGVLPVIALHMVRAAEAGNTQEVLKIDQSLQPLWELFRDYGSLRVVYAALGIMGLTTALPPRPILPLSKAEDERLRKAIQPFI